MLLEERTVWDYTKTLLQKQFMSRAALSMVWMGFPAWFGVPVVDIKGHFPVMTSSVQGGFAGIMWQYLCTSKTLILSKIPSDVIIKLVA